MTAGVAGSLRSGEVARAAGIHPETLRYYERRGLLATPARDAAGHRRYPPHTVTLLRMIKGTQRLGVTLDEVVQIIAGDDIARSIESLARRRVAEIDAQVAELTAIRETLARYLL